MRAQRRLRLSFTWRSWMYHWRDRIRGVQADLALHAAWHCARSPCRVARCGAGPRAHASLSTRWLSTSSACSSPARVEQRPTSTQASCSRCSLLPAPLEHVPVAHPTLHINGEHDPLTRGVVAPPKENTPCFTLRSLPSSGHFLAEEQPDALCRELWPSSLQTSTPPKRRAAPRWRKVRGMALRETRRFPPYSSSGASDAV